MRSVHVVHRDSGVRIGAKVAVADTWWRRLVGLLGRSRLEREEGMLLLRCGAVHTAWMRFAIDVAFLDAEGTVVHSISALPPWRVGHGGRGAVHALELPAGSLDASGTVPGVRLIWS